MSRLSGCAVAFVTMAYPPSLRLPDNREGIRVFQK
jgi:hypothetical protein